MHIQKSQHKNSDLIITNRDIEVFKALSKYHLTGKMLYDLSQTFALPFTSLSNTRTRLLYLLQRNYLKRDQRLQKGRSNNENYYFLTRKSARFFENLKWISHKSSMFRPVSLLNQAHTFMISEIMVKLELDANLLQGTCRLGGFIRENYFIVKGDNGRIIKPDGTFFLNVNGQNFLFFLEIDRSTTVVRSDDYAKRTFEKKIRIYSEFKNYFWQNNIIHSFEGIKGYRVLTVCISAQRAQNLINLANSMNKNGMFWFTTVNVLLNENQNCLFDRIWTLPDSKVYPLF